MINHQNRQLTDQSPNQKKDSIKSSNWIGKKYIQYNISIYIHTILQKKHWRHLTKWFPFDSALKNCWPTSLTVISMVFYIRIIPVMRIFIIFILSLFMHLIWSKSVSFWFDMNNNKILSFSLRNVHPNILEHFFGLCDAWCKCVCVNIPCKWNLKKLIQSYLNLYTLNYAYYISKFVFVSLY